MSGKPPGPLAENARHFHDFVTVLTAGVDRYPFGDQDVLVHEARVLALPSGNPKYPAKNLIGFFDLLQPVPLWDAIRHYLSLPEKAQPEGIYITVNPVDPNLLAVADHEFKAGVNGATDADVLCRNYFYVDADPVKRAKISATDAEKAAAWELARAVRADLTDRGFPPPMVVDSGNGFHDWRRVQLPADEGGAVERLLKALARRHDTARAKVDTTVFNPSRLCKIPGTFARKGSSVKTRPHRMARVLEVPPC
ncbi:MAG TPA: hypothetical protein VD866_24120 [Urbifossiella sp.]|nr:hypothetical protein [Urbifossiella sp.]